MLNLSLASIVSFDLQYENLFDFECMYLGTVALTSFVMIIIYHQASPIQFPNTHTHIQRERNRERHSHPFTQVTGLPFWMVIARRKKKVAMVMIMMTRVMTKLTVNRNHVWLVVMGYISSVTIELDEFNVCNCL